MLPECGCRNGCFRQLWPNMVEQRTCRLGYVPPKRTKQETLDYIATILGHELQPEIVAIIDDFYERGQ
jgi:hypothetical protein